MDSDVDQRSAQKVLNCGFPTSLSIITWSDSRCILLHSLILEGLKEKKNVEDKMCVDQQALTKP